MEVIVVPAIALVCREYLNFSSDATRMMDVLLKLLNLRIKRRFSLECQLQKREVDLFEDVIQKVLNQIETGVISS